MIRLPLSQVNKIIANSKRIGRVFDTSGPPRSPETSADRRAGDTARDRRRWEKAIFRYSRHLARYPEDFAIWVQIGHAYKEIKDFESARSSYQSALDLDPEDADLLLNFGHLEKMCGDFAVATLYYRRSFAIDRNSFAAGELHDSSLKPYLLEAERAVRGDGSIRPAAMCHGRLEAISGWRAEGWVVGAGAGAALPEVLFFQNGRLVGSATPTKVRPDLFEYDVGTGIVGFEAELDLDFRDPDNVSVSARLARSGQPLDNSPLHVSFPETLDRWLRRRADLQGDELSLIKDLANPADATPLSIVMPVYDTRADWLRTALESVVHQWCEAWELICVDDASSNAHVRKILAEYADRDIRVRPLYLEERGGISRATNAGIAAARGNYVAFMDHDDALEPDAVWRILDAAQHGPSLIYSDEAITGQSTEIIRHIVARPAFSYDYYLSHPYFVHFIAVRRELAAAVGLNEEMTISADVDFVLRVLERSKTVAHVPAVLYRWRTHETSAGHARKGKVTNATLGALNGHLRRLGVPAIASEGLAFNGYRIDYEDDPSPTLVIIPTKDRVDLLRCAISSIMATTSRENVDIMVIDHDSKEKALKDYLKSNNVVRTLHYSGSFNFAKMNNIAVAAAERRYKYVLFCNNDIEAFEPGWLEHMRGLCSRSDVGVVGATLLYSNKTIQHSGVVMGLLPLADHAHKFKPYMRSENDRNVGYNYSLIAIREYSAVTAACMIMRREIFDEVGGFDEEFAIGFNDTDLCLRVGNAGYKILVDPYAVLYHHESASRAKTSQIDHPANAARLRRRWSLLLQRGDPFYSPLLDLQPLEDHNHARPDTPYQGARIRPVALPRVDPPPRSERDVASMKAL